MSPAADPRLRLHLVAYEIQDHCTCSVGQASLQLDGDTNDEPIKRKAVAMDQGQSYGHDIDVALGGELIHVGLWVTAHPGSTSGEDSDAISAVDHIVDIAVDEQPSWLAASGGLGSF